MAVSANRLELLQIADAVAREKSIDRQIVIAAMEDAIQKAARSTVNIHSEKRSRTNDPLVPAGKKVNGMGTGIVIDERGYIVTNYHVVQDVDTLQVTLMDNTTFPARVVSFDSREDLAVIKITPNKPMIVAPMGTSSDLMLGEDVLAIGNAFGYSHTVTRGIISQLGRDVEVNDEQAYRNLIQIDAAINPGNSGGPLINSDGDVIAINGAIRAGAQKIGFAIPIDDARRTIARLLDIERLHNQFHGVAARDIKSTGDRKLVVDTVLPNSPAAQAGVKPGDVIVQAGPVSVIDGADFERALVGRATGEKVSVTGERSGARETMSLQIAALTGGRAIAGRKTIEGTMAIPNTTVRAASSPASRSSAWNTLGLKLGKLDSKPGMLEGQTYSGGMVVSEVRPGSPAHQNGIKSGDVLVGLHVWETVTQENVDYVLNHPQFNTFSPLKFYILREKETLYGHFQVASK